MAMRGFVIGVPTVVKESGGKYFLSRAVAWTDAPEKMPKKVKARTEAFKTAVAGCKAESKSKAGTVWGVSDYNRCIAKKLKKVS